jgi:predicted DNA-binding antitoxin AbrB/MazE fold protein
MYEIIEAVFDGKVFRPQGEVKLQPNTRVEITITVKTALENPKPFRVRSKHLEVV